MHNANSSRLPSFGGDDVVMCYHHGGLVSYRRSIFDRFIHPVMRCQCGAIGSAEAATACAPPKDISIPSKLIGLLPHQELPAPRAVPVWSIRLNGRELI